MNNRVMFMIINQQIIFLVDDTKDHREWYLSLGYPPDSFESIIRGYIVDNKIVFFKGSNFQYDEEVIKAAYNYTSIIRSQMNNPNLEVYCGILINGYGEKWEPILKINDSEIATYKQQQEQQKNQKPKQGPQEPTAPIIEFKNDYMDDKFIKRAIIITSIVLVLTLLIKVYLFSKNEILHPNNMMDILLSIGQLGLLGYCIYGYKNKKETTKYVGIIASFCMFLTFDILDIIIAIFYFLFSVDQNYLISMKKGVNKGVNKVLEKTKKDK